MTRRDWLRTAAGSLAPVIGSGQARRPNLLFLLTDDQRYDALGCLGNSRIRTPNLDRLGTRAVRFTNSFVSTSVCSASRAACLTGLYGSVNGVTGLGGGLRPGQTTIAPALRQAGYNTSFIGKWHLDPPATPSAAGFEHDIHFISNGSHTDRGVIENGKQTVARGFIEDYLSAKAVDFIEAAAAKDQPFFLNLCTQLPHMDNHDRWVPRPGTAAAYEQVRIPMPRNWRDSLDGKPAYLKTGRHSERGREFGYDREVGLANHIRQYYACITDLDRSLGRVFDTLDRLRLWDNTVVVLMGDNGWFLGEHGFSSKVLPYEESIRVPFLLAAPGLAPRVDTRQILNVDIAPTLLDYAGIAPSAPMHGRSLRPQENPHAAWRTAVLYEALDPTLGSWPLVAVRDDRWKYIQTFDLKEQKRLVFEELYDLKSDPAELKNLAQSSVAERDRMRALLGRLRREYWN